MKRFNFPAHRSSKPSPLHLPGKELRAESEAILRDVAFALALTRRVKEQIVGTTREFVRVPQA